MATETAPPSKIARIEGTDPSTDPNFSRDFDTETQKALEEIDSCQNEIDSLNEKASEEILKVEQKYNKLRKPHYEKRNELIQKIPRFWLTAFLNHPQISAILDEDEEECLQHLKQVEVEEFEDIKSGYKIKLIFESNSFFKETILVKEFHLATSGEPECKSTQITWTEGKNLVKRAESNQKKALKGGMKRNMQQDRTFFQWFLDEADPSCDDIAEVLKDDMWPNPLQYFLASDLENGYDEEDDDDDLDEDDDEDDDEDGVEIIGEDTGDIDEEDDEDLDEDDDGEGEDDDA